MRKTECFNIRLFAADNSSGIFDGNFLNTKQLLTIRSERDGGKNPIMIVADPFLFTFKDELFLFYEEKRFFSKGVIRMIKTRDLHVWTKPVTVLEEPFHLSYPFVFEDNGSVYMIPETSAAGEVRLYRANKDLTQFFQNNVLLKSKRTGEAINIDYSDSSVIKRDGKYYLMTTQNISGTNKLQLYIAKSLLGPYVEHPFSPIMCNQKYGRNAGCLILWNGKLHRVAQDCSKRYGDNVHIFEVLQMDNATYSEILVRENFYDPSISFYKEGGHQLNIVEFLGKTIIATDAKEYKSFFVTRVFHKIMTLL